MSEKPIRVFKVMRPECGKDWCIYREWDAVLAEFDGSEDGDIIHVTTTHMTPAELDALPDFAGW